MKIITTLILTVSSMLAFGLNRNNIWCFGDSAGINFSNISQPVPVHSAVKGRGSCVSICDTNSNLLFYVYTRATLPGNTTLIKNRNDSLLLNGDNVIGRGWYMELLIIPDPADTTKYFLFTEAETSIYGFYYSIIDMTLDNGLGAVTQKNIQLLPDPANDGLTAVKHGNGRDWWVIHRKHQGSNNAFYKFLVSPTGISGPFIQNIGSNTNTNTCRYIFNKTGDKLAMILLDGLIETFDFDRCTGMLSNHVVIRPKNTSSPYPGLWSCVFSPNDRFLYVSSNEIISHLIQIDLQDTTPWVNVDTLWSNSIFPYSAGALKRGPDDKIYLTCTWNDGITFNFPYPDTLFNNVISNLSIINTPDGLDTACNFTPYSFYLGGNRTYLGLPNNPDYDLGPLVGSPCDTLSVGINEFEIKNNAELFVFYHNGWQIAFINAKALRGKDYKMNVYDMMGKLVYLEEGKLHSEYFTRDLNYAAFAKGVYIVSLQTEKERLVKKFVKN